MKRTIDLFTAGCPCCDEVVKAVQAAACPSCEVRVHDLHVDKAAAARAKKLGVHRVPAVVINGQLADCCSVGAVDLKRLRALGLGVA